ncbi:MAG: hypothetical protein HOP34_02885 [Methylococcaceae bacterium]|nr:hypothetical protein [Methylococcaceae bacterium]
MAAQALPITNELADEINSYALKNRKPTDWQIRLLKNKANKLRGKIPESDFYVFQGMIASLERDIGMLSIHFQTGIKLDPSHFHTQYNYLVALNNAGAYSNALAHGKLMLTEFPGQSNEILSWLVKCASGACRMREALVFLSQLSYPSKNENYQLAKERIAIFEASGLNDDVAERLQSIVSNLIQKNNLYHTNPSIGIINSCIHYHIYVDLPIEDIFEINWQLANELVENTENTYSDTILFEFESIDVLEESLA